MAVKESGLVKGFHMVSNMEFSLFDKYGNSVDSCTVTLWGYGSRTFQLIIHGFWCIQNGLNHCAPSEKPLLLMMKECITGDLAVGHHSRLNSRSSYMDNLSY